MAALLTAGAREPIGRGRSSARVRSGWCCPTPRVARLAEHPTAESDCHRLLPAGTEPVWAPAHGVPAEELLPRIAVKPIAGSGCRHRFPAGPGAVAPTAVQHVVPGAGPVREPGPPARRNSARWSRCVRALVASVPHRPARPRASAQLRWSEVCRSYSSPEQQFCHRTPHIFLEKVVGAFRFYARVVPGARPRPRTPPDALNPFGPP